MCCLCMSVPGLKIFHIMPKFHWRGFQTSGTDFLIYPKWTLRKLVLWPREGVCSTKISMRIKTWEIHFTGPQMCKKSAIYTPPSMRWLFFFHSGESISSCISIGRWWKRIATIKRTCVHSHARTVEQAAWNNGLLFSGRVERLSWMPAWATRRTVPRRLNCSRQPALMCFRSTR